MSRPSQRGKQGKRKLKLSFKVHIERGRRKRLVEGDALAPEPEPEPQGTIPRISRLLALAHHLQGMLDRGEVKSMAEIARLGHVTRARVTQIMNLLLLAPDIQEEILFLPPTTDGRDPLIERDLRRVLRSLSFRKQRRTRGTLLYGSCRQAGRHAGRRSVEASTGDEKGHSATTRTHSVAAE